MTIKELIDALNAYVERNCNEDEEVVFEDRKGNHFKVLGVTEGDDLDEACILTDDLYDVPCPEDEVME